MSNSTVDYNALDGAVSDTLNDLDHWFIHPSRILLDDEQDTLSGGYGDVHRATFVGYETQIAVKKLRPAGSRRQRLRVAAALARELRVWERANHPNVLRLVGFYLDRKTLDCAWLVTWWQWEGDILDFIDRTNADEKTRLQLAQDTADGLAYLHTQNICHGDIKSANTLVNSSLRAMICDFGLAKIMEDAPSGLTTSSRSVGTVRYTSPELIMDPDYIHTFGSDTWAWGCLILQIITRTEPYAGVRDGPPLIQAIAQHQIPAKVDTLDTPHFVKRLLRKTWSIPSDSRPSMQRCSQFLKESISLWSWFSGKLGVLNSLEIPRDCREKVEEWSLTRNPAISEAFQVSVSARVSSARQCLFGEEMSSSFKYSAALHDRNVSVYERESGKLLKRFPFPPFISFTHFSGIDKCRFSADDKLLAMVPRYQNHLLIWEWATGTVVLDSKMDHAGRILDIAFSDLENTFLVCTTRSLQVWDVDNASTRLVIPLFSCRWTSTWSNLAAGESPEGISVWNIRTGATVLWLPNGISCTWRLKLMKAGILVVTTATTTDKPSLPLEFWDVGRMSGAHSTAHAPGLEEWPKRVCGPITEFWGGDVSADKQLLLTCCERTLVFWDLTKGTTIFTLEMPEPTVYNTIRGIRFTPQSTGSSGQFVVATKNHTMAFEYSEKDWPSDICPSHEAWHRFL